MSGFQRALAGEWYLLTRRKGMRWAILLVAIAGFGRVAAGYFFFHLQESAGGGGMADHAAWNFWPQFALGTRAAMFLAELMLLGWVASSLPREIASGAARDPLTRKISRSAFMSARVLFGFGAALVLWFTAFGVAWLSAHAFFDPGDIMEGGDMYLEQAEVRGPVYASVLHALPPLLALGALATFLSAFCRRSVLAAGAGLICILLPGIFHDSLGTFAPWIFADTLGGFGEDSFLVESAGFASAIAQAYPADFDAIVKVGWIAPWPALLVFGLFSLLAFRKRPL